MFTGCNALLPNEIRPAEALPILPRNPRGANVGYYTVTCDKDYNLVPVNLLKVEGGTINLQDLVNTNNTPNLTLHKTQTSADQIMIYNGAGYTEFWLHNGKGTGNDKFAAKWVMQGDDGLEAAEDQALCNLTSGSCFFFVPKQTAEPVVITIPGQVPAQVEGKLVQGYNLIGSGMPADFVLNGEVAGFGNMTNFWTAANGFTRHKTQTSADQIMVYNGAGYTEYWLHNGKGTGNSEFNGKWVLQGESALEEVVQPIPATSGFFFLKYADGEIDFKPPMPYSL